MHETIVHQHEPTNDPYPPLHALVHRPFLIARSAVLELEMCKTNAPISTLRTHTLYTLRSSSSSAVYLHTYHAILLVHMACRWWRARASNLSCVFSSRHTLYSTTRHRSTLIHFLPSSLCLGISCAHVPRLDILAPLRSLTFCSRHSRASTPDKQQHTLDQLQIIMMRGVVAQLLSLSIGHVHHHYCPVII